MTESFHRVLFLVCCGSMCVASTSRAQQTSESYETPRPLSAAAKVMQQHAADHDPRTTIRAEHTYTLAELIDLAEQHNPTTRIAWQQARAQAAQLGIARSELFPALTAVMMTNTSRDGVLFNSAFVRQTLGAYEPMLQVNYLVLDFGTRGAAISIAREQLLSANLSFNRAHLDVLFATSRFYYLLLNTIGQQVAAKVSSENAAAVQRAVEARLAVGLATLPDVLEARAAAAQANFALQEAIGQVDITRGDLLTSLGASPASRINVQSLAELKLPDRLDTDVDGDLERAVAQRPEIGIQVAEEESARFAVRAARAGLLPDVRFTGAGGTMRSYGRQDQLPDAYRGPLEQWNVTLSLEWPVFDGGRRRAELARAHADEQLSQANLDQTRDDVESQVWTAYINARTAFHENDAATILLAAAQTSYEAALKSYGLGLRNTVDVVTAQRALAQALSSDVKARTDVLLQLATLAYRTGDLLKAVTPRSRP